MIFFDQLKQAGIRIEMDESSDPIGGKIKTAQLENVPWMLIIGKKEVEKGTIALRKLDGSQEFGLTADQLIAKAQGK